MIEPPNVPAVLTPLGAATVVNDPASAPVPVTVPKKLIVTESPSTLKLPTPEKSEPLWLLIFSVAAAPKVPLENEFLQPDCVTLIDPL